MNLQTNLKELRKSVFGKPQKRPAPRGPQVAATIRPADDLSPVPTFDPPPFELPTVEPPPELPTVEPVDYEGIAAQLRAAMRGDTSEDAARALASDRLRRIAAGLPLWGNEEPLPPIRVLSEEQEATLLRGENLKPVIMGSVAFLAVMLALSGGSRRGRK